MGINAWQLRVAGIGCTTSNWLYLVSLNRMYVRWVDLKFSFAPEFRSKGVYFLIIMCFLWTCTCCQAFDTTTNTIMTWSLPWDVAQKCHTASIRRSVSCEQGFMKVFLFLYRDSAIHKKLLFYTSQFHLVMELSSCEMYIWQQCHGLIRQR